MNTVQVKLEDTYHDKLLAFLQSQWCDEADVIRYMIDTLQLTEVNDVEFAADGNLP